MGGGGGEVGEGVIILYFMSVRQKAKSITSSIARKGDARKEEALDDLPSKDERESSSIRRTLELFQRQR